MVGRSKNLRAPDEKIEFPLITEDIVELGDMTVARTVQQPGWRWSIDLQPIVGGDWCQAHHVGFVESGRFGVDFSDGSRMEFGPDDVYDIPPGHDGYTVGDEPVVMIEWSGIRSFARSRSGSLGRVLATLLFTDLVDSTATAVRLGDVAWRDLLERHYHLVRSQLERFSGREIATTGDGFLASFDAPASALRCASAIRASSIREEVPIRIGIHVGEVDVVGTNVRGIAVHEAARVMAAGGTNEVMVSEMVRTLTLGGDFSFEDRGVHKLKGLPHPVRLFACID